MARRDGGPAPAGSTLLGSDPRYAHACRNGGPYPAGRAATTVNRRAREALRHRML